MTHVTGRTISHESAAAHVTGEAKYVDDVGHGFAGLAHAWPVMAPHARARVLAIDTTRAIAAPGVLTVLTSADVRGDNDIGPARRDEPLFPSEVTFHGQAVAWVVAETEEHARGGAGAVRVSYEELPAVLSIADAIEAQSFLTDPELMRRGNAAAARRAAPHQFDGEIFLNGQEHFYLEAQVALAWIDESANVFVHSSTQHPSETQEIVARVLGVPRNEVIVQCLRMGGAFGGKEVQANAWAAVAALAAHKLRRPVKVRLTRYQDMVLTGKRHPFLARFRAGASDDGRLSGLSLELFSDGGWCLDLSAPIMSRAMFHVDNCYLLRDVEIIGRVCKTNHVSHTAFRGFGGPQGMVAIEEILDRIARRLSLPPHVVRERNFYRSGDRTHYGQVVRDADRVARIWSELKESSDFDDRLAAIRCWNAASVDVKRGLAITPVKFGISFTTAFYNQAGALVLVYKDGSVQVNHGGTEMGQGLHTKMLQVAAEELGVPLGSVRIMATRTDKVPNTSATAASSGSDLNGAAVRAACATLRSTLAEVAARAFPQLTGELDFADGRVHPLDRPDLAVSFADVVVQAYLARTPLFATGYYQTPGLQFDKDAGVGEPFAYFAYGAAVSEVEVDGFTGQYRMLRTDILQDVGDSLSPLIDRGQVEGGFIQGLGWLTTEELVWTETGVLATNSASTYKLPSLGECPLELNVAFLTRASEPGVIFGSKAVGEPPLMLAISVREALRAAVAAFGHANATPDALRVDATPDARRADATPDALRGDASPLDPNASSVDLACPATPEAVFWAIERVKAQPRRPVASEQPRTTAPRSIAAR